MIEAITSHTEMQAPKTVFLPSQSMMRQWIDANVKFSPKDDDFTFLLRFGVVENPSWYV